MPDPDALDERLRAVERALTDGDNDLTDLRDAAELTREVETLSARLDDVEDRLDELDAATQALRGYVGNVRAVNEAVERRADAALAKAETLEEDVSTGELDAERPRVETRDAEAPRAETLPTKASNPDERATAGAERTELGESPAQGHPCRCDPRRTASESDTEAVEDTERCHGDTGCPHRGTEDSGLLDRIGARLTGVL